MKPIYSLALASIGALALSASDLSAQAILAHCEARLPDFKRPRHVILRDELPRTPRGKLDRNTLVAAWRQEETADD